MGVETVINVAGRSFDLLITIHSYAQLPCPVIQIVGVEKAQRIPSVNEAVSSRVGRLNSKRSKGLSYCWEDVVAVLHEQHVSRFIRKSR